MDVNSFVIGYNKGKASAPAGVELNIHYSETEPPEDTTKLWCKTDKPSGVIVSPIVEYGDASAEGKAKISVVPSIAFDYSYSISQGRISVGDKAYLFGGWGNGYERKIHRFDLSSEKITTLTATLPTTLAYFQPAVVGKNIYIFGGATSSSIRTNAIIRFDTETETAETIEAVVPISRENIATAAYGNWIFLFGGNGNGTTNDSKNIYLFNTEDESIKKVDPVLGVGGWSYAWPGIGEKIYVRVGSNLFRFNAKTGEVTDLQVTFPRSARDFYGPIGTKLYQFGESGYDDVYYFDLETEEFGKVPITMPTEGLGTQIYANSGKIYFSVGKEGYLFESLSVSLGENIMQIITKDTKSKASVINSESLKVEVGIDSVYKGDENGDGQKVDSAVYTNGEWSSI